MQCPRCGAQLSEGATFCNQCGSGVAPSSTGNYDCNQNNSPQNNNKVILLIIGITLAVIVLVIAAIIAFTDKGSSEPAATSTPMPTAAAATTAPEPTSAQEVKIIYVTPEPTASVSRVSAYESYYSSKYDFSCNYPSDFNVYDDGGTLNLCTVKSPDGRAFEKIAAKPNTGETVDSEYRSYLMEHSGVVEYDAKGDNYFALRIDDGTNKYYKYCAFRHGNLYWFEMIYPSYEHEKYDEIINSIYQSIRIHGTALQYN